MSAFIDGIVAKAKELGIDLSAALCEDPATSEYLDEFVTKFQKKREKKGMTLEKAREIMSTSQPASLSEEYANSSC